MELGLGKGNDWGTKGVQGKDLCDLLEIWQVVYMRGRLKQEVCYRTGRETWVEIRRRGGRSEDLQVAFLLPWPDCQAVSHILSINSRLLLIFDNNNNANDI